VGWNTSFPPPVARAGISSSTPFQPILDASATRWTMAV
jgi:hypothetical protein